MLLSRYTLTLHVGYPCTHSLQPSATRQVFGEHDRMPHRCTYRFRSPALAAVSRFLPSAHTSERVTVALLLVHG